MGLPLWVNPFGAEMAMWRSEPQKFSEIWPMLWAGNVGLCFHGSEIKLSDSGCGSMALAPGTLVMQILFLVLFWTYLVALDKSHNLHSLYIMNINTSLSNGDCPTWLFWCTDCLGGLWLSTAGVQIHSALLHFLWLFLFSSLIPCTSYKDR